MYGFADGLKLDALKFAGEETAVPLAGGEGLGVTSAFGGEYNEAGEVFVFAAEAIEQPRAHAGAS